MICHCWLMYNTLLESSIVLADVMILCALNLGRMRQIFEVHFGIMLCVSCCRIDAECWIDIVGYVIGTLIALHYIRDWGFDCFAL